MTYVFLSYAFAERSRAMAVRAALVADGWSIWMDNSLDPEGPATSLIDQLGVPPGQEYDALITRAIEDAAYFVALDSDMYRARAHCVEELEHAKACGKPIVFVPGAEPDLELMRAHRTLADAHARLFASFRDDERSAPDVLGRTLLGDPRTADARLVAAADLDAVGMRLPPGGENVLGAIVRQDVRRRWTRRVGAGIVLVVLAALAGTSTVAGLAAASDRRQAADAQAAASSLELAARALRADTTRAALRLAREAVKTRRSDVTTSALRQVEAEAAGDQVLRIPSGVYLRAGLSPDGAIVGLARRDAVVVVDVKTGETTTVPADGLRRRIAVTDDRVLVVDLDGTLWQADTEGRVLEELTTGPYIDMAVDGDDVWLLTEDSTLEVLRVGSDDPIAVLGAELYFGNDALAVDSELSRVYLLRGAEVWAFPFEDDGTNLPVLNENLWRTSFGIESNPDYFDEGTNEGTGVGDISVCGHNIAASQGWKWSILSGQRHQMFSPEGDSTDHWTFNSFYSGAGCGLDGTAWTRGALDFEAESYDRDGGWAPESVGQETARQPLAIASRPDGRTVVAEASGVLHIIERDHVGWSRDQGRSVAAQPLDGGMAYVDDAGRVTWVPAGGGESLELGDVGGALLPSTAASSSAWFLTTVDGLVRVSPGDSTNPVHIFDLASDGILHDPTLSPDGSIVCMASASEAVCAYADADSDEPATRVPVPLTDGDGLMTVEWNNDRILATTTHGRILLLDLEGDIIREVVGTPGGSVATFVSSGGDVVATTGDGFMRRYDADLREVEASYIAVGGLMLRRVDDEQLVLGTTFYEIQLVDSDLVQIVARLETRSTDVRRAVPDVTGTQLVSFQPMGPDDEGGKDDYEPGRLTVIPLPGHDVVLPD